MDVIKVAIISKSVNDNATKYCKNESCVKKQGVCVSYIYEFIKSKYPILIRNNWKNTVRHTLSFKPCFQSHRTKHKNGTWTYNYNADYKMINNANSNNNNNKSVNILHHRYMENPEYTILLSEFLMKYRLGVARKQNI